MPHILGKRILLREYRLSDLPELRKWVNDPLVTEGLSDVADFHQRCAGGLGGALGHGRSVCPRPGVV